MKNKLRIENISNNKYAIVQELDDGSLEKIAEVFDDMDALLLAYMIDKALSKDFDEGEFKEFVLDIAPKVPFLKIPKQ